MLHAAAVVAFVLSAGPDSAELSGAGPFRIVCRFHVVRHADGSGGIDETRIAPALKDLNIGFRDTPFYFVREPGITYIDDNGYYADIPVLPQQGEITDAYYTPGVLNFFLAPIVAGGATGGAWYGPPLHSHERGIFLAYFATGEPSNIVTPIHEAGHVFKLRHPFDSPPVECTSGVNCLTAGDFVCDTPASPIVFGGPGGNTTATGIYFANQPGPCFNDPPFDPDTRNYMDAGWPAGHILRNRFTPGQIDRMILYAQLEQFDLIAEAPDVLIDCDGDGLDDPEQILAGNIADDNLNFVPDSCEIFPRADDLLVTGMTQIQNNKIRYFDGATGDYRESMWNGMPWVHQLRMGPDGHVYLVTLTVVQRMDLATGRTIENFIDGVLEGAGTFVDLLFEPDGNILVLDNLSWNIRRYDGVTGALIEVFSDISPIMTSPKYMAWGPDNNILVVGNAVAGSRILEIDATTGALLGSLITPGAGGLSAGQGITVHTDGLVYVSNAGANNVLRYDASTGAYAGQFVSPGSGGLSNPHSLRFGPDGNLYVASRNNDSVKIYDGTTGAPLGDFVAPGTDGMDQPTGLLFVPRNPGDVDGDGSVGINDFLLLLAGWGPCPGACPPSCAADFNANCTVGIGDFLILLANWS